MMRANSAFFPRNNPSECPDNVRVPASSAWACHNPEVTADWNSDPRSSGECRLPAATVGATDTRAYLGLVANAGANLASAGASA